MREIYTQIEIKSPAKVVWRILTDLGGYPLWNPFLPKAEGELEPGAQIKIKIKPPNQKAQDYLVKILRIDKEKALVWLGHFYIRGLIDGEHHFEIHSIGESGVRLVQREYFRGLLVPFVWNSFLNTHLRRGFEELNQNLKIVAERSGGQ